MSYQYLGALALPKVTTQDLRNAANTVVGLVQGGAAQKQQASASGGGFTVAPVAVTPGGTLTVTGPWAGKIGVNLRTPGVTNVASATKVTQVDGTTVLATVADSIAPGNYEVVAITVPDQRKPPVEVVVGTVSVSWASATDTSYPSPEVGPPIMAGGSGMDTNKLLLGAAAIGAIYFLTKK